MDGDAGLPRSSQRQSTKPGASAVATLRNALGRGIEICGPAEAEEPILAPNARAAVFEWLTEIRAADDLKSVGLRPRSTALLFGPPGCGKTTLAHHLAARLGIPMVIIGSENVHSSPYMGEAENGVAKIFSALKAAETPCVVFMDEMEGWGGKRDQNNRGGADNARTSILGVLLRKIEEFRGLLIGATNREKDIDPALWRRFGMQIQIDLPTDDERFAIMRRYLAPYHMPDDSLDVLVEMTAGASPALLRGLMESVKRALVLAPRMNRNIDDVVGLFGQIVAALHPPPELTSPPLWHGPDAVGVMSALQWPPTRTMP